MNHDQYPDTYIRGILNTVKTIAMVGVSPKENRPSYFAFKYLLERGYRMIPVNPGQAGKELLGQTFYAKLSDIPEPIDIVGDFLDRRQFAHLVVQARAGIRRRRATHGDRRPYCPAKRQSREKRRLIFSPPRHERFARHPRGRSNRSNQSGASLPP